MRISFLPRTAGILEPNFYRRHWKLQSVRKFFIETFEIVFVHFMTLSEAFHQNSSLNISKSYLGPSFLLFNLEVLLPRPLILWLWPTDAVKSRDIKEVLCVVNIASLGLFRVKISAECLVSDGVLVLVEVRHEVRVSGVILRPALCLSWLRDTVVLLIVTVEMSGEL